jgi:hypothetical protein
VKKPVLPSGSINIHISFGDDMKCFEFVSNNKWTLGMILRKIYECMIIVSKLEVIFGKNPDGSDYYSGKLLKKINIHAMDIYAKLS